MRPNIALLYIGGSIGMVMNKKTGRISPVESLSEIHQFLPELQKEAKISFIPISQVGSSEVTPAHWVALSETIKEQYKDFDGFVVVHGTNTLSYTASALSFALQGLSKPIVLTGALLPINELAGDGRRNLILAMRAAQLDIAEVCVVAGPRVIRGTRAKKARESVSHTFESPRFPTIAEFSRDWELHPWRFTRRKRTLSFHPHFDSEVALLTLHPGMPATTLKAIEESGVHGIVLRSYGPGMVPENLIPWMQSVSKKKIPIVLTSQVLESMVDLHRYRKQMTLEKIGIISGKDMTYECAVVKLMWALSRTKNPKKIQEIMEKNLVGEMDD